MYERDGVQVVCDTVSMDFLKGAVVEYEDNLMRSAFQVRCPSPSVAKKAVTDACGHASYAVGSFCLRCRQAL